MRTRTPPTAATWPATAEPHGPRREAGRTPTCADPPRLGKTAGQRPFPVGRGHPALPFVTRSVAKGGPAGGSGGRRGVILTARWGRAACLGRRSLGRRLQPETLVCAEANRGPPLRRPSRDTLSGSWASFLRRYRSLSPHPRPFRMTPRTSSRVVQDDQVARAPGLETTQVGPGEQVGRRPGGRYSQGVHHHPRAGAREQAGMEGHPSPCQVSWWSHGWR